MSPTTPAYGLMRTPLSRQASRRRRRDALVAMIALAIGGGLLGYLSHQDATGAAQYSPLSYVAAL